MMLYDSRHAISEKVGWCCRCITNRSGWLIELLTELLNNIVTKKQKISHRPLLYTILYIPHTLYTFFALEFAT